MEIYFWAFVVALMIFALGGALSIYEGIHRLSEPELALRFHTSRSPIREALSRLEHEGFIERLASGRVRVAALDVSYLEQLYVVRANLEGLAARLAAPLLRTVDLDDAMFTRWKLGDGTDADPVRHNQRGS